MWSGTHMGCDIPHEVGGGASVLSTRQLWSRRCIAVSFQTKCVSADLKNPQDQFVSVSNPRVLPYKTRSEWLNLVFPKSNTLSLTVICVCFCSRWQSLFLFFPTSPLYRSCLTSLRVLRCASSCAAPSDPTGRNTCKSNRKKNREQLVNL